jgi:class 3 adenylate cyclase/predicted ATPase
MRGNAGFASVATALQMRGALRPAAGGAKRFARPSISPRYGIVHSTDLRPINITILHEVTFLSVSLTDSRSVGRFGRIDVPAGLLDELKTRAAPVLPQQASGATASIARGNIASQRQELGSAIFSQLLPESIRDFLIQCPPRYLYLQLSESLVAIPWEIAFDGEHFLGEKFRISRQIICDEEISAPPPARSDREFLNVLIVGGNGQLPPHDAYPESLLGRFGTISDLSAKSVHASGLGREEALRLIGESDVVHYVGPMYSGAGIDGDVNWWNGSEPITVREIANLPYPPQLLVSENTGFRHADSLEADRNHALAKAACRSGLNILVRDSVPGGGSLDFMQNIYRELTRGSALGEAVRHATAVTRRKAAIESAAYLDAALYGDSTLVLFSQLNRARQKDDLRQVTTMSHDLVDSTRLLGTLGAEKYSDLLAIYHRCCASIVARHGGVSDDPQGDDGIMCYFGVPVAREDSAVQSLRAGLEIIDAVAELGVKVRIGIVTGQVVVKAGQPVGAAIHLAARLQSIAEPGTLLVGDSTRQIVKEKFEFQLLDRISHLKGFDRPAAVYRLLRESRTNGTDLFDAAPRLTPFVGREHELRLLEERWAAARKGGVRTVLVSGEAGIGKSRLVHEFKRSASLPSGETIECRCTPDHTNTSFHPVIDFLRRLLRIRDSDSVESKLDKIDGALASVNEIDGCAQLIAALLSIPFESRYKSLEYSAEKRRQLTLDTLVRWICRETGKAPMCLIIEDIQWVDPSTREFLELLITKAAHLPLFVLLTQRSDAVHTPDPGIAAYEIELRGLSPDATRAMILGAGGESSIPDEVVSLLADKADGVPLYIEESTRMAVDLGAGTEAGESAPASKFTVPATIQDLLMARLDRLESAKQVAQLGAVIGREFSFALMQAVLVHESSPTRIDDLPALLGTLLNSGLLIEKGEPPDTSYYFKHALVRDAAYQSLWERHRTRLHRAIAIVIGEKFRELVESQPELLAYHYAESGMDAEAVAHWERAARRAASRSAHAEALSHLASGLALTARLPAAPERDRAELRLQLLLAGQLIATEGYGADAVGRAYARASELCDAVGDESALTKILLGLEGYHFMRANFKQAHAIAAQAAAIATRSSDPMRRLQSTWAVANVLFHQGDLVPAVEQMDACLDEYRRMPNRPRAVQDPGVMCLCYSAWGKWQLGYPDEALARARQVVALSENLDHKFSMGEAYGFCTAVHHFRGENAQALQCAERAIEICEDNGFAIWLAHAKLMRGRIVAEQGNAESGIEEMRQAYDMWTATGAVVTTPFYLAMQAEGLALAGRPDEGLALLECAFDVVCKCGERYYEAEIRRLSGELILQSAALRGADRNNEAERWFLGALEFAEEKQLRSLSLRSAINLSRLRMAQGRSAEAMQILEPVYEWFGEGRNTRDLDSARALVENLRLTSAVG